MSPVFDAVFHAGGLGSSDVAAIVGLSHFKGPWQVWLEKTNQAAPEPENEAMVLGHLLEPVVLELYAKRMGCKLMPGINVVSHKHPWRRAQLDGEVDGAPTGLEVKTAGLLGYVRSGIWGDEGTDQIPQPYLCQAHWQMLIRTDWDRVHVPVLLAGRGLQVFSVERHFEFERWLAGECDRWWLEHVVGKRPPEVDGSDECARYLARIHPPKAAAEWLEATPEIDELALQLQAVRDQRKALEAREDLGKNRLRSLIGDARGVRGEWGVATWGSNGKGGRRLTFKWSNDGEEEAA